ncbi:MULTISPECIES: hypothetical protein [unclassified Bradyrhizobium]|uniref:hypothetical protein n=1 Tax=Bradyrhizobium sp. USDA 4541 TaxID=2817704 RepID=UPI0020A3E6A8|nr:hypothetical protein [Bradyrhizobium sp. USDA 4541]MCP1852740.1 hypothetical protein [Bradyrhizobium sp. USDA 4541]
MTDLLATAEAFRVAMIESGAVNSVGHDRYFDQLRALERALQPLNYLIPPDDVKPAVESDIAIAVTMLCPRRDCSIKIRRGEETCMGWPGPTYDRDGKRTDRGDPNRVQFAARCERCEKAWSVRTRYEQIEDVR